MVTDRVRGERAAEVGPGKGTRLADVGFEARVDDELSCREWEGVGLDVGPDVGSESSVTALRGVDRSGSPSTSSFRVSL